MHRTGCRNNCEGSGIDVYTYYETGRTEASKQNCCLALRVCESAPRRPSRDPALRSPIAARRHQGDAVYFVASPDAGWKHLAGKFGRCAWAGQHNSDAHARVAAKKRMDSDETWCRPPRGAIDPNCRRETQIPGCAALLATRPKAIAEAAGRSRLEANGVHDLHGRSCPRTDVFGLAVCDERDIQLLLGS